jgi:hypothetical protein
MADHNYVVGNDVSGYRVAHGNGSGLFNYPNTPQGYRQAEAQCKILNAAIKNSNQSSMGAAAGAALTGVGIGAGASLVGFGLKGIWKILIFPVWLMFWMFKLMFWMFKGLFYTFPKFLWSKGTAGKISCGVYLFAWSVAIFIESMGKTYVFRNWIYLSIILFAIVASAVTTITFRLLDRRFTKRFAIALFSGIFVIGITLLIGMVFTKHLRPLEGEIIPIEDRYKIEDVQPEMAGNESVEE